MREKSFRGVRLVSPVRGRRLFPRGQFNYASCLAERGCGAQAAEWLARAAAGFEAHEEGRSERDKSISER